MSSELTMSGMSYFNFFFLPPSDDSLFLFFSVRTKKKGHHTLIFYICLTSIPFVELESKIIIFLSIW